MSRLVLATNLNFNITRNLLRKKTWNLHERSTIKRNFYFQRIIQTLQESPVFKYFEPSEKNVLVNSSKHGLGASLLQENLPVSPNYKRIYWLYFCLGFPNFTNMFLPDKWSLRQIINRCQTRIFPATARNSFHTVI